MSAPNLIRNSGGGGEGGGVGVRMIFEKRFEQYANYEGALS